MTHHSKKSHKIWRLLEYFLWNALYYFIFFWKILFYIITIKIFLSRNGLLKETLAFSNFSHDFSCISLCFQTCLERLIETRKELYLLQYVETPIGGTLRENRHNWECRRNLRSTKISLRSTKSVFLLSYTSFMCEAVITMRPTR